MILNVAIKKTQAQVLARTPDYNMFENHNLLFKKRAIQDVIKTYWELK